MPQVTQGMAGRLAWTLFGVTVVLLAASAVIGPAGAGDLGGRRWASSPPRSRSRRSARWIAARTGNRLGWLFLAAGVVSAITVLASVYAARPVADRLPGAAWAGWGFTVLLGITGYLFFADPAAIPGRAAALAPMAAGDLAGGSRRGSGDGDLGRL